MEKSDVIRCLYSNKGKGLLKIPRGKGIDALRGFIAFCIIIIAFGIPL